MVTPHRWLGFCSILALLGACSVSTRGPALPRAATAPEFSLRAADGQTVALRQLLAKGPAIVVFYRGHW